MTTIIPAILENSFTEIEKKINILEDQNPVEGEKLISWIQIDFADGTLFPNTTFLDPTPFGSLKTKINLEAHLMVSDPLRYVERFAASGFKRFYAHIEGDFVQDFIEKCYQLGLEVGLAIDGPTPTEKIHKYLDNIDAVLVMAIEAGASGRPFREDTINKIKNIKEKDFEIPIGVDGAMNPQNVGKVVAAGANRIYANSYVFGTGDVKTCLSRLQEAASLNYKQT